MLNQIWTDKGMPPGLVNKKVIILLAEKLWKGAIDGYGNNFGSLDADTPDWNMLLSLQKNVWHFSAAKNYTQLRELSNALIGDDGKLRTESQFRAAAFKINDVQIKQHLSAEYDLAMKGSQMAGKWVDIEADKETLPLLEFDAVVDGRTTELCLSLNGTVLPIDDPFWNIYYPPNHFNCRSGVRQLSSGVITKNVPSADIPTMFQTNLAKEGLIYPPEHPYFIDLPHDVIKQADKLIPKEK